MTYRTFSILSIANAVAIGVIFLAWTWPAWSHQAHTIAGDPLGWLWPPECCNSAATSPTGDCAVIDPSTVTEGPDGYHVNLKVGDHPRLKTKGYSAVIPYGLERNSPSGEYGICLTTDGSHRFCFFAGGKLY